MIKIYKEWSETPEILPFGFKMVVLTFRGCQLNFCQRIITEQKLHENRKGGFDH